MFDHIPDELLTDEDRAQEGRAVTMTEGELESIVNAEVDDAVSFIDSDIGPKRADALKYYRGDPFGNEEEGRSQFVSRDVADVISAALPSLMRVFFGPENVVEFVPESQEDEELAQQQTDYVNHIVTRDNPGFEIFYAVIKDALRSKVGIAKYWWDDSVEVYTSSYSGLDMDSLTQLLEEIGQSLEAEIVSQEETEQGLSVTLKLKKKRDRVAIAAVPPEEFLISRDATSVDTARLVGHRRDITASELVAMGYDRELVGSISADENDLSSSEERLARNEWAENGQRQGPSGDKSSRIMRYVEAYILVDHDLDGIAELRKVCMIGQKVVHNEPVSDRPFADFHCDPEPHTFFGESLADKTMDVQKWKSALCRAGLDSLASSIFPRTVVGDRGNVNMDDMLNNEVGSVIRATDVAQVQPLVTPDVSPAALTWLAYADEVRENRTGMSKTSMGLDAESLQNTTATAAEGQFTRSQERIELIARIMSSGMRRLFRGISGLVAANQRKERTIKLRNKWVPIDPRRWRVDMDVQPNVALGGGSDQQKAQLLALVLEKQEGLLALPGQPLVTMSQYHAALAQLLALGGFKNPDQYFRDPEAPDVQAEMATQPPPKDPKVLEVEGKLALEGQKAQAGAQLDEAKATTDAELALRKLDAEMALKRYQVDAELSLKREQLAAELILKREQMAAEMQLQRLQADHHADMAERKQSADIGEVNVGGDPG